MTLDPLRHRLTGHEVVTYRSGADSALHAIHLHAYPNAFRDHRTIYAREGERWGEDYAVRLASRDERGWMTIDSVTVDGARAAVRLEDTAVRVDLPRPLLPRDSVTLRLRFTVQVPKPFNRFGHTGEGYAVAQWYPKIAVHDDRGWHPDPYHYFSEFYGDYGSFDVSITLPDRFWVGATGLLRAVSGGDNEIPLADTEIAGDSVTVTLTAVTADSLRDRWPRSALTLESDLEGSKGKPVGRLEVKRGEALRIRVPRGAPVHYRYAWSENEKERREEADRSGRPGPLRFFVATRDTTVRDTLRALAAVAAPQDSVLPSMKTLRFHAEHVHDFAWVASPDYVRADTVWNGIFIRALCFRSDQGVEDWRDQRASVVSAMRFLTREIGPYVWPSFTSAESYMGGGAMEYPMLIMNDPEMVSDWTALLDVTIGHELAHNWFYGMLGSDERAFPWLDEGFTQYMENRYSEWKYPDGLLKRRKLLPWTSPLREVDLDEARYLSLVYARDQQPIMTPADGCQGYNQYAVGAYSKPALMLHALRRRLGEETFRAFLHEYYRANLLRHPRPEDVRSALRRATGRDLTPWLEDWIESTRLPRNHEGVIHTHRFPPLRLKPLFDVSSPERMTFVYGPMVWHGRAEGARLGIWTVGRYLTSREFPDGVLAGGGSAVLGTRRGDFSFSAWGNGRLGVFGARDRLGLEVGRDAGLFRVGARLGGLVVEPGRRHPFREWSLGLDYRDRYDLAPVDSRYWSSGRGLHGKGLFALETKGPRREERVQLDLRGGGSAFGDPGSGAPGGGPAGDGPEFAYERVSLEATQKLGPLPGGVQFRWRAFAGSAFDRPPRELLFDAAEGGRVDSVGRFYLNDRGPLLRSGRYWMGGGGGLRGYHGRAALGKRVWALNADVEIPMLPVSVFGDLGRVEIRGLGESGSFASLAAAPAESARDLVGRTLGDAGIGYELGPLRLMAPLWVGRPQSGEKPWRFRWIVSIGTLPFSL